MRSNLAKKLQPLLAAGVLATIVMPVAPGSAAAKGAQVVSAPSTTAGMSLRGSNGYGITVHTFRTGRVSLIASNGKATGQGAAYADYLIRGRATPRGLTANFGELGRVSVRFKASSSRAVEVDSLPGCKGRKPVRENGRFRGTIRFRGEQGYTSVSATSAEGSLLRTFRMVCPRASTERRHPAAPASGGNGSTRGDSTALVAFGTTGGRATFLDIAQLPLPPGKAPPADYLVTAGTGERRGRILIQRRAMLLADPAALSSSPFGVEPTTATLSLPGLFTGTGTYLRQELSRSSWTGDLSVSLPGAGVVPLAGEGFRTVFCHGVEGSREFRDCEQRADAQLKPVSDFPFLPSK